MKEKIIATVAFLCFNYYGISQKSVLCGEVYYTEIRSDQFGINKTHFQMTFNNKMSYSEEILIEKTDDSKTLKQSENPNSQNSMLFKLGRTNLTPKFYYNTQDDFFFRTILLDESIVVKEDKHKFNWIIHSETRQVGKFICKKATTTFRGRDYVAWYSSEIPIPLGPWKFYNLPGLILEVSDVDRMLVITTDRIKIAKESSNCEIDLPDEILEKALSRSKYNQKAQEIIRQQSGRFQSLLPRNFRVINTECKDCPKGLEIFEQEKEIDSILKR